MKRILLVGVLTLSGVVLLAQTNPPPPPPPPSPPGPSPQRQMPPEGQLSKDELRVLRELTALRELGILAGQGRNFGWLGAIGAGASATEIVKNLWDLAPRSWKMFSSETAGTFLYNESSGDVYKYDQDSKSFKKVKVQ